MMLPLWLQLKIEQKDERNMNLHLPLFLLWLILLPFALLALPFLLIWCVVEFLFTLRFNMIGIVYHSYLLCCATRGTTIDVREKNQHVLILIK